MILRKGMRVLVNATNIGHPPVRPYPITLVNQDTVFLEGWWDRMRNQPLHVPKEWLWPILDPGERVAVRMAPSSPLADNHVRNVGILTVHYTAMNGDFASAFDRDSLPCAVWMAELGGELFDPRFLDDPIMLSIPLDKAALKAANTSPGAKFCAACGGPLKDPGMGPAFRFCPKCEP